MDSDCHRLGLMVRGRIERFRDVSPGYLTAFAPGRADDIGSNRSGYDS